MTGRARRRIIWMVGLGLTGSACADGTPPESARGSEAWRLSQEPALEIGVVTGDERYQLHDVADAARLVDGRIAVAHRGTSEIRVYDADGRFLIAAGGPGDGPGEWRGIAAVHALSADTLVVVDPRLDRVGLVHAATGVYLGTVDEARATRILPRRLHHAGLVLEGPADFDARGALAEMARAVDIRSPEAPVEIRLDDRGRGWVLPSPSAEDASLRVLDPSGRDLGRLPLPARFVPLAVDGRELIGVWRDSLDVEHLRIYAVEAPTEPVETGIAATGSADGAADAGGSTTGPASSGAGGSRSVEAPELVARFRNVAIAQEMHYATAGSYTTELDALADAFELDLPATLRVDVLAAGPTGWWGRLVDRETGAGCTLVYGAFLPVEGLTPGSPACWEGREEAPTGG